MSDMDDIGIDLDVRGEDVILTGLTVGQEGPGFVLNLVADDDGNPSLSIKFAGLEYDEAMRFLAYVGDVLAGAEDWTALEGQAD